MIRIGEYQTLTIHHEKPEGFYLGDDEGNQVLMPSKYISDTMKIGDQEEVFVYGDSQGRDIATTEKPLITLGQFAFLRVAAVDDVGAFCDWGVSKQLFIPYRNQGTQVTPGQGLVVLMYLDGQSGRLVGTAKLNHYLQHQADAELEKGQEVDLLVYDKSDLGYRVVIDQTYAGLLYGSETPRPLELGEQLKGYIKPLREDGKIDVSYFPIGHQSIEPNAQKIMTKLEEHQGFLPFTDKSSPEEIRKQFGISKKLFKKSLGNLYKQKLVILREDGIYKSKT
jgi:predicted RNA-binding protein (virulence factor B family)